MAIEVQRTEVAVPTPHRFTVDDYYKMGEVGILGPNDRVQLIDGVVFDMPPIGAGHADSVDDLNSLFQRRFGANARVRIQQPVRLGEGADPEPDVVLARLWPGVAHPYRRILPAPKDTLLVVEVSDSTLTFDLGQKALMYARHDIQDLWVLDILGERLVVHREPSPDGYRSIVEFRRGDTITPLAFPDTVLTLNEILGEG